MKKDLQLLSRVARRVLAGILFLACTVGPALAADEGAALRDVDRDRAIRMLDAVRSEIAAKYFDPAIRGHDLAQGAELAKTRIAQATSIGAAFAAIAQFTLDLDDSHTFFLPPRQTVEVKYGWTMAMIGDAPYVVHVAPGSDAEKQGVHAGDRIKAVNGLPVTRESLWRVNYLFNVLRPQPGLHLELVTPKGEAREIDAAGQTRQTKKVLSLFESGDIARMEDEWQKAHGKSKPVFAEVGKRVAVARVPSFMQDEATMREVLRNARGHEALVLDLRGNPGGAVLALQTLLGGLFDHDVAIGVAKERERSTPLVARSGGGDAFTGRVFVLVDSRSASAAEILARVVQLQHRGTVIGDRSAGAVMESRADQLAVSHGENAIVYGASVTIADLVMSDGASLEKNGVVPDVVALPTADDLAAGRDPALSKALALAGQTIDASAAATLLPPEKD